MDEPRKFWQALWYLSAQMRNICEKSDVCQIDKFSRITVSQARVLSYVFSSRSKNIMLKDIANKLRLSPGATSLLVDTLVKRGMLVRNISETDRRAVSIGLDESGEKLRENFEKTLDEITVDMTAGIPEKDLAICMDVLEKISKTLADK